MFITDNRPSWASLLAAAILLGLMTLLSGCGGGGASSAAALPLTVIPGAPTVYAYQTTPTYITIRGGVKPFNVYSNNTAVISFNNATMPGGLVPDETIELDGPGGKYGQVNNVNAATTVNLIVRDAAGTQVTSTVTVNPSSLNSTLTITGDATQTTICPGGAGVVCSGYQGTASVTATTTTGAPLPGHQVLFQVLDQGAKYGFVCNQSLGNCLVVSSDSAGHVTGLQTTTDTNGNAYAVIKADANVGTQFATISATDQATGQVLDKQFLIQGTALAAVPASGTWTISLTGVAVAAVVGPPAVAAHTDYSNSCPGSAAPPTYSIYTIYGGSPPYTVSSLSPLVGSVALPPAPATTPASTSASVTVASSGGSFLVYWPSDACTDPATTDGTKPTYTSGTASITVIDSAGARLTTLPTFVVTVTVI